MKTSILIKYQKKQNRQGGENMMSKKKHIIEKNGKRMEIDDKEFKKLVSIPI